MTKIIPVTLLTKKSELIHITNTTNSNTATCIGLPFKLNDRRNILNNSYVTLSLKSFLDPTIEKEAVKLNSLITRTVLGNSNRNEGWHNLMGLPEIKNARQNINFRSAWTYMLINVVLNEKPKEYLEGSQHLADFFAERLQIDFGLKLEPPFTRPLFHQQLLKHAIMDTSLDLKIDLAFREQKIVEHLQNMSLATETYAELLMIIVGLCSGIGGVTLSSVLVDAFTSYIQLIQEMEKAEKDGKITEQEAFGSWVALLGIFLPFSNVFKSYIGKLIDATIGASAIALILLQIASALIQGANALLQGFLAEKAGFNSYDQFDPDHTIFIPYYES